MMDMLIDEWNGFPWYVKVYQVFALCCYIAGFSAVVMIVI